MYDRILVPVDGSDASNHGLDEAIKLGKKLGSRVKLIHVVNELLLLGSDQAYFGYNELVDSLREGGKKILATAQARATAQGVQPETALIESVGARAADVIVHQAKDWGAPLIVLGGTNGGILDARAALGRIDNLAAAAIKQPRLIYQIECRGDIDIAGREIIIFEILLCAAGIRD